MILIITYTRVYLQLFKSLNIDKNYKYLIIINA